MDLRGQPLTLVNPSDPRAVAWEQEGVRLSPALVDCFAAVVIGADPAAAACVALGIAQIQSKHRRVAICDLVGDVPPLQSLVKSDDPHGIVDSFQYGVSLNKIAYQVDDGGNLFIMPSGTEPVVDESIIRSDRWRRLSGGFREVGALLLLVARADAAGLAELVTTTDGVVIAGEVSVGLGPVLATARLPRRRPSAPVVQRRLTPQRNARPRWHAPAIVVAVVVVGTAVWWMRRHPVVTNQPVVSAPVDTIAPGDSVPSLAPPELIGDSASAAAYAVEIVKLNTQSGAILKLHDEVGRLPAVTYSPVTLGNESARWFVVATGAFPKRSSADSLLGALRERRILESNPPQGFVVRLPYALVLQWDVSRETAAVVVRAYIARELPAYALLQDDGTARIYAGAFETRDQAALLAASVRAAGIEPTVAYRMGRTF